MIKYFLTILFTSLTCLLSAQEISVRAIYYSSNLKPMKSGTGYSLSCYQYFKQKQRLGLAVSQIFCSSEYDDNNFGPMLTGPGSTEKYFSIVTPHNQRVSILASYEFRMVDATRINLFIGPGICMNYFKREEDVYFFRYSTYDSTATEGSFRSINTLKNRFGMFLHLDFTIREFLFKRMSASISLMPELSAYTKLFMKGGRSQPFTSWMSAGFGISYKLAGK